MNYCIGCVLLVVILLRKVWHCAFDCHKQSVPLQGLLQTTGVVEKPLGKRNTFQSLKKLIPQRLAYLHSFSERGKNARDRKGMKLK